MAELKTQETRASVSAFIDTVAGDDRRKDCRTILKLMQDATGEPPKMWGSSIVGFGRYRYQYADGRENEFLLIGFSPRKSDLTLYITRGFEPHRDLMAKLGKYRTGKACLYIKSLEDIDVAVLKKLIARSVADMAAKRVQNQPDKSHAFWRARRKGLGRFRPDN